jgi:hypothetical protein
MMYSRTHALVAILALAGALSGCDTTGATYADRRNQVIISVTDQKLTVVKSDSTRETFPISTSRYGLGDQPRSFATPVGKMEIAGKIGAGASEGTVFHGRVRTGEIVPENAPGRDPIVTRILRLRGLEAQNARAESRGIYIHGTPQENLIGEPVSFGCIRMRSRDVVRLFDLVGVGSPVMILDAPMTQAIAVVSPPRPMATKPATLAENPGTGDPATANQTQSRVLTSTTPDANGVWAGDPNRLLEESTPAPKQAPAAKSKTTAHTSKTKAKSKSKSTQFAQRTKYSKSKVARSESSASL